MGADQNTVSFKDQRLVQGRRTLGCSLRVADDTPGKAAGTSTHRLFTGKLDCRWGGRRDRTVLRSAVISRSEG